MPTLTASGLVKRHLGAGRDILSHLDLTVHSGETVAILGPSGSGKSTLLHCLGTLDRPDAGCIRLGDTDLLALTGEDLRRFRAQRLGLIFQEHHLLPHLSALENVLVPPGAQLGSAQRLLNRLGLTHRANAFPAHLSGGERQRVAVARALINAPHMLLCDEPTGSLDRATGVEVAGIIFELAAEVGAVVVIATHDDVLGSRCARRLHLNDGALA
ncbi:MAG: ABC transporter ATP-binding protein [Planctomycetota bacterium]